MLKHKKPSRWALTILFSGVVFTIITLTMIIIGWFFFFLNHLNLLSDTSREKPFIALVIFIVSSIVTGTLIATLMSRIPLKPMHTLIDGMNQLSKGDYNITIDMGRAPVFKEISKNFNTMAKELNQTEVLRTDFVNNLSHEFKTPIVSILGFAKILQKSDLTPEQKEFVDIIVTESSRLTNMTTNMLALTKIENQHILTDQTTYNVSEQIRQSIILLEKNWSEKNLLIEADFGEAYVTANEELLKQVWINLMDNSIKYSPENETVTFLINDTAEMIEIIIKNSGPKIDEEIQQRIFSKYWQEDVSHSSEGTGIGLSISKKIVDLHHGEICVESNDRETQFIVRLPKN